MAAPYFVCPNCCCAHRVDNHHPKDTTYQCDSCGWKGGPDSVWAGDWEVDGPKGYYLQTQTQTINTKKEG